MGYFSGLHLEQQCGKAADIENEHAPEMGTVPDSTVKDAKTAGPGQPPAAVPGKEPAVQHEPEPALGKTGAQKDADLKAHEEAEAKRKAEWEAKRQTKIQTEQAAVQAVAAMTEQEALKAAASRVRMETEKLTRRNMKECVAEYIQTLCLEDTAFARLTLHPRKSMVHCFQYINRKAWDYVQDELKTSGLKPDAEMTTYGTDIPDDLCYQWAEDYFRDPDVKEDREEEDAYIPRPYPGKATPQSAGQKKAEKNRAAEKPKAEKKAPGDGQLSLLDLEIPKAG